MSVFDKLLAGSHSQLINQCDREPGAMTLSQSIEAGSQGANEAVSASQPPSAVGYSNLEFEFFDKDEQKRREEYRSRVEKHYCRLVEEERLSPESASVLSDAFAEAEDRAKYGSIKPRSEVIPEYHTGIDKTVWKAIDHQRSKSFERQQRCKGKDSVSDKSGPSDRKGADRGTLSVDMEVSMDSCEGSEKYEIQGDYYADNGYVDELGSSGQFSRDFESSDTLNLDTDRDKNGNDSENICSEGDEFDFENDQQREWRSKRGDLALGKSMETWMGSPKGASQIVDSESREFYREKMKDYREKAAAKERGKLKEMLKQSSAMPNASPTPFDYDADEESFKDNPYSPVHSEDHSWSDNHDDKSEENTCTLTVSSNMLPAYQLKPMSSKSSVTSEKSRLDPLTYQCYTAGILHSSGKSDKFLRLQKHFAVLERIREIEDKTKIVGSPSLNDETDSSLKMELFAKYDVQSMEELQWLYQELSEAQKNEEFFYDLQKLAVFQWKPTKDYGLKRRGKSLNDLKKVYENLEEEEAESVKKQPHLQNTFFQNAMRAEKEKIKSHKHGGKHSNDSVPKVRPIVLYGTNIPERLDDFEIYVESKKQLKTRPPEEPLDNLHIRSMSAPYSKHQQEEEQVQTLGHKRSDSSKGSMFGATLGTDKMERKTRPTVAEVSPVQRPVPAVTNKPPVFSKIMSGPHDFASRATSSDSIARPMQSNLQIYNSLENPQYQASVNLDEPINPRKLLRGRSSENFMVSKDGDGQSTATTPDRTFVKFPDQRRKSTPSITQEASQSRPAVVDGERRPFRFLRSGVDSSRICPVRSVIAEIENRAGSNEHAPVPEKRGLTMRRKSEGSIANPRRTEKYVPIPNLHPQTDDQTIQRNPPKREDFYRQTDNQTFKRDPCVKKDEFFSQSVEVKHESPASSLRVMPFTSTITSTVTTPAALAREQPFKVRDLRSLARNNEFSQYKFVPTSATSPDFLTSSKSNDVSRSSISPVFLDSSLSGELPGSSRSRDTSPCSTERGGNPVLHRPVMGQIFKAPVKTKSVPDFLVQYPRSFNADRRRNSDSSTDTFIIKGSDDESDAAAKNRPHINGDTRTSKSKSVPDLAEEYEPRRPRSAKSYGNLKHNDSIELSGRHCIPRTVSGDIGSIQNSYRTTAEFGEGLHSDISETTTPRNSPVEINMNSSHIKQTSYERYMPPVEIMSEMMKSSNRYRRSEPLEKRKTPSVVGKMTLDYLHVIGSEWEHSKDKIKAPDRDTGVSPVPNTTPFVGSDRTTTPNVWVPTIERKQPPSKTYHPPDYMKKTLKGTSVSSDNKSHEQYEDNNVDQNSIYKKYLSSAPQKPLKRESSLKFMRTIGARTVPRAHTDRQTNRARDAQVTERGR